MTQIFAYQGNGEVVLATDLLVMRPHENKFRVIESEKKADFFQYALIDMSKKFESIDGYATYIAKNGELITHSKSI